MPPTTRTAAAPGAGRRNAAADGVAPAVVVVVVAAGGPATSVAVVAATTPALRALSAVGANASGSVWRRTDATTRTAGITGARRADDGDACRAAHADGRRH